LENNYDLQNNYYPKDKTLVDNPCILILTLDNQRDYTIGNTNLSHNPILNPTHNLNYNKYIRIASPQIINSQQVQGRNLKQVPVNSQSNAEMLIIMKFRSHRVIIMNTFLARKQSNFRKAQMIMN
jgi:hypothetical protein